jgi:hypothetical protein
VYGILKNVPLMIVSPPKGVVNGPGPCVVVRDLLPGLGRLAGSGYTPLSCDSIPKFPSQIEDVRSLQVPDIDSVVSAVLAIAARP